MPPGWYRSLTTDGGGRSQSKSERQRRRRRTKEGGGAEGVEQRVLAFVAAGADVDQDEAAADVEVAGLTGVDAAQVDQLPGDGDIGLRAQGAGRRDTGEGAARKRPLLECERSPPARDLQRQHEEQQLAQPAPD